MKIKELRQEKKISQYELAKFLNVSQVTYGRYELGICEPTIDTLCKLADFYHVTLDYLVGREFSNDAGYLTDDETILLQQYRAMKPQNKAKYLGEGSGILIGQQ